MSEHDPVIDSGIVMRLAKIESLNKDFDGIRWRDALKAVRLLAHQLVGTSSALGRHDVNRASLNLYEIVTLLLNHPDTKLSSGHLAALRGGIAGLVASHEGKKAVATLDQSGAEDLFATTNREIYVLDKKDEHNTNLIKQLGYYGYNPTLVRTPDELKLMVEEAAPACIIVGDNHPSITYASAFSEIQHGRERKIPMICMAKDDTARARLEAIQIRCDSFFAKPIDPSRFVDRVDHLTSAHVGDPYRVLLVDDSATQAMFHASILNQAGIATTVCSNPLDILQPLTEVQPDLVLLDMYMPGFNGVEIAGMIRQHDAFVSMPVVFLSGETNVDKQLEAMRQGGDDFLNKPIRPDRLVSTVVTKIERSRVIRSYMLCDSLTGLYNHTTIKKILDAEISRAIRHNHPLSFSMIDIDKFKSVNDTYGHPTGDRVIKSLSRLLRQSLRKSDVVGRYGGEEFAVILPHTNAEQALVILDRIRLNFSKISHQAEGGEAEFFSSFSAGVAEKTDSQTASAINNIADTALYCAKLNGRNQVCIGTEESRSE